MTEKTQLTNGEKKPTSQFLSHLNSYPVVSDSVTAYKSHPWGAKSVDLAHSTYELSWPYLKGPYSYLAPYLAQIDQLAASGLTRVDSTVPQVRRATDDLRAGVRSYVGYPAQLVGRGREYLTATWGDEYQRTGSQGNLVHLAKAIVSTELRVAGDVLAVAKDWVQRAGNEAAAKGEGVANGQ